MNPLVSAREPNLKEQALELFGQAAFHISPPIHERIFLSLLEPERVLPVRMVVRMDDGSNMIFQGWRSQHCSWPGPTKGGIRLHSDVTQDEVIGLSMFMTWKCGLIGLPYGGAKGAITVAWDALEFYTRWRAKKINPHITEEELQRIAAEEKKKWRIRFPRRMSDGELKRIWDEYVKKIYPLINREGDIVAPDLETGPKEMGWFMDAYSSMIGYTVPSIATGKPLSLGGSQGRDEATGRGCFVTIMEALKRLGIPPLGASAAIMGYGKVGFPTAYYLHEAGIKIVAISDFEGGIINKEQGLDPKRVFEHRQKTGSVVGFKEADNLTNKELLELPVTILVPAATQGVITEENAPRIKARILAEAANAPTTIPAISVLNDKNIFIIPDILCNAGGVTVSYFEWVQGLQWFFWDLPQVQEKLDAIMKSAFERVAANAEKYRVSTTLAAHITGISRVVQAGIDRGKAI